MAIRSPSDSKGIGQCFALQGSRIATPLRARNDEVREAGAPAWAWAVPHALQNWEQNLEKAVDNSAICAKIICDIATQYEKEAV